VRKRFDVSAPVCECACESLEGLRHNGAARVLQGVARVLQARVLQRCYKCVTRVLQRCYKNSTRMSQGCYKALGLPQA
jgi:hypothetical protein